MFKKLILFVIVFVCVSCKGYAEDVMRVGINLFEPFVMVDGNIYKGFSIDLWKMVAKEADIEKYEFKIYPNVHDKLMGLINGEIDIAIGGITTTSDREKLMDFTVPTYQTGLDIMVRTDERMGIWDNIKPFIKKAVVILLVFVVIIAHFIWFAESRAKEGKDNFYDNYIPGIFEAIYFTVVTGATVGYGDFAPAKWPGRIVTMFVIIFFIPVMVWFQAQVTTLSTLNALQVNVNTLQDLNGKKVGTVKDTSSEPVVDNSGATKVGFKDIYDAVDSLVAGNIDAIVYDAPNLNYIASKEKYVGKVIVADHEFYSQMLFYALPSNSILRENLNIAILRTRESDVYEKLMDKWFK